MSSLKVIRILFDGAGKRTLGVEYVKGNRLYRLYAKKEVILSAGAVQSPQLLLLSGIGPEQHLRDLGRIDTNIKIKITF